MAAKKSTNKEPASKKSAAKKAPAKKAPAKKAPAKKAPAKKAPAKKAPAKKAPAKKAPAKKAPAKKAPAKKSSKKAALSTRIARVPTGLVRKLSITLRRRYAGDPVTISVLEAIRTTTDATPIFDTSTLSSLSIDDRLDLGILRREIQDRFTTIQIGRKELKAKMTVADVVGLVKGKLQA